MPEIEIENPAWKNKLIDYHSWRGSFRRWRRRFWRKSYKSLFLLGLFLGSLFIYGFYQLVRLF